VTLFLAANESGRIGIAADRKITEAIRNRRLKMLIIDDTARFRDSMTFLLTRKYGGEVTAVESGRAGIELVQAGIIFNVIFLDLKMPDMDGLETHAELRHIDVACRIVIMSAHRDSQEWKIAEDLDLELVEKPIPDEKLVSILLEL
jgi:DNA-binding NtrC family response regulator